MTAPGPQHPTISYLVHRAVLIGIMLVITLSAGFVALIASPELQQWVVSAIQAVRDEWMSWHWSLLSQLSPRWLV